MAETEIERAERQMAEARAKLNAAKKREREKQRRDEQKRRQIIGAVIAEYGDTTLTAMIDKLLTEHAAPADYHLWPHLWPEHFPATVADEAAESKPPANRGEQALADLRETAKQSDETQNVE